MHISYMPVDSFIVTCFVLNSCFELFLNTYRFGYVCYLHVLLYCTNIAVGIDHMCACS